MVVLPAGSPIAAEDDLRSSVRVRSWLPPWPRPFLSGYSVWPDVQLYEKSWWLQSSSISQLLRPQCSWEHSNPSMCFFTHALIYASPQFYHGGLQQIPWISLFFVFVFLIFVLTCSVNYGTLRIYTGLCFSKLCPINSICHRWTSMKL